MILELLEKMFKLSLVNQIGPTQMMIIFGMVTFLKIEFAFMNYTLSVTQARKPFRQ